MLASRGLIIVELVELIFLFMEWIAWFLISFIFLVLVLINGGLEGCLTAGLLALAVSSVVAWLPFPFYVQATLFVLLIAIIFVALKRWEASSGNPLASEWGSIKNRSMGEAGTAKASVVSDFSSADPGAQLRVIWQGQSWAAKCSTTPCQLSRGVDVEVIGRDGTSLVVKPVPTSSFDEM